MMMSQIKSINPTFALFHHQYRTGYSVGRSRGSVVLILLIFVSLLASQVFAEGTKDRSNGYEGLVFVGDDLWKPDTLDEIEKALREAPWISGINEPVTWKIIEPQEDSFQWNQMDRLFSILKKNNRIISITLTMGLNDPAPDWIFQKKGVRKLAHIGQNPHLKSFQHEIAMPYPLDDEYAEVWFHFIKAFAERYRDEAPFVAIHLGGIGDGPETFLPSNPEDMKQWEAMGFTDDKLISLYKKWIDFYGITFPSQRIILDVCKVFGDKERDGKILRGIIDCGISQLGHRFGIQHDVVHGRSDMKDYLSQVLMREYSKTIPVGLQSAGAFKNASPRVGDMDLFIYNVMEVNPKYLELWWGDRSAKISKLIHEKWQDAKKHSLEDLKDTLIKNGAYKETDDYFKQKLKEEKAKTK